MKSKTIFSIILVYVCLFANIPCAIGQNKNEQMKDPRPIVRIHDTSVNPFILSENGMEAGDPFPSYWDGVWHLYTLRSELGAILHFTSTDLVKWTEHEPAMVGKGIATGTVVRDDNQYYMFYTDSEPQEIRLVVSDNPWVFDYSKSKLVAKADDKVYQVKDQGMKFRDCHVFYYEKEQLWWMLIEATSDDAVAVALFKSKDLLTWTQHDPISKEKSHVHGSCPQVFEKDGRWYLTYLDNGTRYAIADTPYGPWDFRGKYHSQYMTAASRSTTDGKRQLCWGFFAEFGYSTPEGAWRGYGDRIGVGREMVFNDDGDIGVRPLPELITAIHQAPNKVDLFASVKVHSGKWDIDSTNGTLRSEDRNGGVLLFDLPEKTADYYFETDIQFESPQTLVSVGVRTTENCERGYRVVMEPNHNQIAIRMGKPKEGTLDKKSLAFAKGKSVKLQIFISGNRMEAFVDGRASLSARIQEHSEHRVAIEVQNWPATFSKPILHYFDSEE
jgi:hypothetical protein